MTSSGRLAGGRPTPQPSGGGNARQVPDPAAGAPRPGRAARASVPGGPATPPPRGVAGGETSRQAVSPDSLPDGRPGPETRRPGPVSVRAGDQTPAGVLTPRAGGTPAGSPSPTEPAEGARGGDPEPGRGFPPPRPGQGDPRSWTIELPAGMPLLSLNGREHWSARHARAQAFKNAAIVMARQAKLPKLRRVSVVAEYQPPDRRHRDGDNIAPAAKAAVDGLVAAGVLAGDDKRYVTGTCCMIGEPHPKGRLVLHLTEVAP